MMAEQTEQVELRPFHETIVEAIERVGSGFQLEILMYLILRTKIPENHDSVIAAFKKAAEVHTVTGSYPCGKWLMDSKDVEESLLAQKKFAEVDKHKNAVLDELEREREVACMRRETRVDRW